MKPKKFPTSVIKDMKRRIAEEYDKNGTAEAVREFYERHIRYYFRRFDPRKLAAWGKYNLELYMCLTENDRPIFEPYNKEPMNVFKELDRVKNYEIKQMITALNKTENKSFNFDDEEEVPVITYYSTMEHEPCSLRVSRVELIDNCDFAVYDETKHYQCNSENIIPGGITEILNYINF